MKAKEFFKSNSFKCILVLLIITLVCGTIIAACAVLFNVSDEERLNRSLTKIYAGEVPAYSDVGVYTKAGEKLEAGSGRNISLFHDKNGFYPEDETELNKDEKERMSAYTAVIQQVIVDERGTCLVKSKGKGCGFSGGSVTVWVQFTLGASAPERIDKVINVGNETDSSQTLIGQFGDDFFAGYCNEGATATVKGGGWFVTDKMSVESDGNIDVVSSGATYTSTAMDVAVNGALYYVREQLPSGRLVYTAEGGKA